MIFDELEMKRQLKAGVAIAESAALAATVTFPSGPHMPCTTRKLAL